MDVDIPVNLKRSSSAPMINELNTTMPSSTTTTSNSRDSFNVFSNSQTRTRRFSASFSPVSNSSVVPPRVTPRVSQLRQEECLVVREVAHERELHSTMVMSQSWEDLTLVPGSPSKTDSKGEKRLGQRILDPLHLTLPPCAPMCSSPSPTRSGLGRQCFSPSLYSAAVWKSGLSPSPTRKSFATRRSLSPIAMRPSPLGPVKRKFELEDDKVENNSLSPPSKRPNSFSGNERGGLLMTHSNRMESLCSPLPGSLSSVGTPESLSSADSPGFMFRPVDSPSPGRPNMSDEPMHEDHKLPQPDSVMTPDGPS